MPQCTLCTVLTNSCRPWSSYEVTQDETQERDLENDAGKQAEECLHHSSITIVAAVASIVSVARLHRVAALLALSGQHLSAPPSVLAYLLPLFCFLLGVTAFCQARFLAGGAHTPRWLLAGLLVGVSLGYADNVDLVQLCLSYLPCSVLLLLGLSVLLDVHVLTQQQHCQAAAMATRCCVLRLAENLASSRARNSDSDNADEGIRPKSDELDNELQI